MLCLSLALAVTLQLQPVEQPVDAHSNGRPADITDITDFDLNALLDASTTVSSLKPTSLRSSPGVLTVYSRRDLDLLGARDLVDVLMMTPGFQIIVDYGGTLLMTFRGSGGDGQILLLWDGFEMNDGYYLSVPLGGRFPLDEVESIEIIRGPGSAIHGGSAEQAVIQVITRSGAQRGGATLSATYGQRAAGIARAGVHASFGMASTTFLPGLELSGDVSAGMTNRAQGDYVDFDGAIVHLGDGSPFGPARNAASDPLFLTARASWLGTTARLLVENYHTSSNAPYGSVLPGPVSTDFPSVHLEVAHAWRPWYALSITPKLRARRQLPWRNVVGADDESGTHFQLTVDRFSAGVLAEWAPLPTLEGLLGTEAHTDLVWESAEPNLAAEFATLPKTGDDALIQINNAAAFGQVVLRTAIVDVTAGARAEGNTVFGGSFVPRVALTRVFDDGHAKLLVSGAFKSPAASHLVLNPGVTPQRTRVLEAEIGVQLADVVYLTANAYDITVSDLLSYSITDEGVERYDNRGTTGSRGIELHAVARLPSLDASLTYSGFTGEDKNEILDSTVPGRPDLFLGTAQHKITGRLSLQLAPTLFVTPSFVLRSERFAPTGYNEAGGFQIERAPPSALINVAVTAKDVYFAGLDLDVGLYDILDERAPIVQSYYGYQPLFPASGFEALARVTYHLPL